MHYYHDAEETVFFPSVELVCDVRGIIERNVEQHRAFGLGFDRFWEYVRSCVPGEYDGGGD